ncbi:unnamed protein product [Lymnaea stagnalis]|uniref:Small ribosomal subunit protein uS5m n=1 Tax=Lymnaea stagnalis TaxID=6523 RepID=A0AAV2IEF4_LYMST
MFKMATSYLFRAVTFNTKQAYRIFAKEICCNQIVSTMTASTQGFSLIFSRTYTSFVKTVTADQLWLGVTSVSNAGRKRGRARSLKKRIDLNRGQRMGFGKTRMVFPGLTGPPLAGKKFLEIHKSKEQEEEPRPIERPRRKFLKVPPLLRGYSGRKFPGTSVGPPDPINDYEFTGFDSKVLEYKMVAHMTGNLGRKATISALVVTGNGAGLAGYAVAKAPTGKAALRKAKNKAAQRLQYFERYNDHTGKFKVLMTLKFSTVFHNFAVTEGKTTLFVQKKSKGHGVISHRVIKTMCEIIGIKDLYVKTEGRTGNIQNVTKAFFRGLMEQETHQQLADRMGLNVVEYRAEMENIPIPVATPSQGFSRPDALKEEAFDFDNLYYKDGRIPLKKYVDPNMKFKLPSTLKHFQLENRYRNQREARLLRIVHGLEPTLEELKIRQKPLK